MLYQVICRKARMFEIKLEVNAKMVVARGSAVVLTDRIMSLETRKNIKTVTIDCVSTTPDNITNLTLVLE